MWRARIDTIDSRYVDLAVTGRSGRAAVTMTHAGSPGPQVRERRPKAQRPCLGCDRMMLTTRASRLCPPCLLWAADLSGGVDEMHLLGALTQTERGGIGG
ncbi:MAG: hypothetical protein ACREXU_23155 [Gammaproteobacteria bacterium]